MRSGVIRCPALLALVVVGCQPELPPASEQDVVEALVDTFVVPLGNVVVVSRPDDCRGTRVPVPPEVWIAFRAVNREDADGLDLGGYSSRLRLDTSRANPELIRAHRRMPVVSLSRIGVAGEDALLCVQVFGAEDRGYYLLLRRDATGRWSVRSELKAWEEPAKAWELPPEELPDGRVYENP